jgi:histidinol-phosphate aminotransferase
VKKMLKAINAKTKLICVASPNNPTGAVLSRADLIEILHKAPHASFLLDEAYYDFYGETRLDLIAKLPNLFIARTFSKAYGMAGSRVGVLMGARDTMADVRKVSSPYNVNGIALACLDAAMADDKYIREYTSQVIAGRNMLEQELTALGLRWWPSEANFVLFRVGDKHAALVDAMRARGILIRSRHKDPGCSGCVRITLGTSEHTARMLAALREAAIELELGRK